MLKGYTMKRTLRVISVSAASVLAFAAFAEDIHSGTMERPDTAPNVTTPKGDDTMRKARDRDGGDRPVTNLTATASNTTSRVRDRDRDRDGDRNRDRDRDDRTFGTNSITTPNSIPGTVMPPGR